MAQTTQTTMDRVQRLFPLACTSVVIILDFLYRFLKAGFVPTTWLITLLGLAAPFAVMIGFIILVQSYVRRIRRRQSITDTVGSILFFITLIWTLVLTFTVGTSSELYDVTADVLYAHAWQSTYMLSGLTLVMLTMRDLRPKNPLFAYMTFLVAISFMAATPLGDIIPGGHFFIDLTFWFLLNPGGVGSQIIWIGIYAMTLVLVLRILLGKETIRSM